MGLFDGVRREARKAEYTTEVEKHLRQLYGRRPPEEHVRAACVAIAYAGFGHADRTIEVDRGRGDVVRTTAADVVEQLRLNGLIDRRRSVDAYPFDGATAEEFRRLLLQDSNEGRLQPQSTPKQEGTKMGLADRMESAAFAMQVTMAVEKLKHAERTNNEKEGRKAAEELRKACQKYPRLAIEAGLSEWITI